MKLRLLSFGLLVALLTALVPPASAQENGRGQGNGRGNNEGIEIPLDGHFSQSLKGGPGTFKGQFILRDFDIQDGQLVARGRVTGEVSYDDLSKGKDSVNENNVVLPVGKGASSAVQQDDEDMSAKQAQQSCDILTLFLGPLHLDLLGLVIDLTPILLTIIAVPGPFNLLGNLLCAIAGLLDPQVAQRGAAQQVLNATNQLVRSL